MTDTQTAPRPLYQIATEIHIYWPCPNYAAVPYLRAMFSLDQITDAYGAESADMIVRYFLSNATGWRGPDARRIKAELKAMLR